MHPLCTHLLQAFSSVRVIYAYNLQGYIQSSYGAMVVSARH
jgi:hypothetical protein